MFEVSGRKAGPNAYETMLQELTYHVRREARTWWSTDHLGTVGAALCWRHRSKSDCTQGTHENRLQQTSTAAWDKSLAQLEKHGFQILGYDITRRLCRGGPAVALQSLVEDAQYRSAKETLSMSQAVDEQGPGSAHVNSSMRDTR